MTLSLLAYLRDRGEVKAWSTLLWEEDNGPERPIPVMYVRIVNLGRRPVVILNLVKRSGRLKWWRPIQGPEIERAEDEHISDLIDSIKRKSVAHLASVRLGEGEVFELMFRTEDCPEFVAFHEPGNRVPMADRLEVEDVSGRLVKVKDSEKHLPKLIDAWR